MMFAPATLARPIWTLPVHLTGGWRGVVSLATAPAVGGARRASIFQSRARPASPDFDEVVLLHLNSAYSLARYLARDTEAAEDIVQEAMLKAYRSFASYRGGDAKAWLLTIVRRAFIDWSNARRAGRAVFTETTDVGLEDNARSDTDTPEDALLRKGEVGAVRLAIEALPEPFREAIVLRELEELSYREVAEITGVPIGTVMSRLARGRELLARRLDPASASSRQEAVR